MKCGELRDRKSFNKVKIDFVWNVYTDVEN